MDKYIEDVHLNNCVVFTTLMHVHFLCPVNKLLLQMRKSLARFEICR